MTEIIAFNADQDKLQRWGEAFDAWLARLSSDSTRRAYKSSWRVFLDFAGKAPWSIGRADVVRFVNDQEGQGLSDCTIQLRVSALSSFYEFCRNDFTVIDPATSQETALHNANPAGGRAVRKKIDPYGKATALTPEQARGLLAAIDRTTTIGLRDYALLLAYLMTGRRNAEIRHLCWRDFEREGARVWYVWSGKRKKDQKYELPMPVWESILSWLSAAGRLSAMAKDDAVFTALNRQTPLTSREVGRILKKYAHAAGLNAETIHVHSLRHTAAMLRREAGDDVLDICEFLGHTSLATTQIYLHRLGGRKDRTWGKAGGLLGLERQE
jgi:site-specific recombinase XerD